MSLQTLEADAEDAWSTIPTRSTPQPSVSTVETALEKERVIKDIISLRDGLRGLLVRITEVDMETDKLRKDNEMLGVYIDNLTRNSVVAAGQKR